MSYGINRGCDEPSVRVAGNLRRRAGGLRRYGDFGRRAARPPSHGARRATPGSCGLRRADMPVDRRHRRRPVRSLSTAAVRVEHRGGIRQRRRDRGHARGCGCHQHPTGTDRCDRRSGRAGGGAPRPGLRHDRAVLRPSPSASRSRTRPGRHLRSIRAAAGTQRLRVGPRAAPGCYAAPLRRRRVSANETVRDVDQLGSRPDRGRGSPGGGAARPHHRGCGAGRLRTRARREPAAARMRRTGGAGAAPG